MEKIIFHIDVNSAFLSWEAVYRLRHKGAAEDLREIPSAVGGDVGTRHGIILAKSIPAKRYNIKTGETISEALCKCPGLKLAPPDYELYERCSRAFMDILRDYTDTVEQYSIDEAFADMSSTCGLFGTPCQAAEQIKNRIRDELGFTVNIGVSDNKLLAKTASDFRKPDLVHTLYRREIRQKLWPLPVSDLFFVGRAATAKLFSLGIRTVGELAASDISVLRRLLNKQGETIWGFANGLDCSPVLAQPPANKGYGNSTTLPFDVKDSEAAQKVLLALAEMVSSRLRADNVQAGVVAVGVKGAHMLDGRFPYASHQCVLETPTNITLEIYKASCRLFRELWDGSPLRHLGIHTSRIGGCTAVRQLSMFDEIDYGRLMTMDTAADLIRGRFGSGALTRASLL